MNESTRISIRLMQPEDREILVRLFTGTVRIVNRRDYTPEQVLAWAPDPPDMQRWQSIFEPPVQTFVAEIAGNIVGFGQIAPDGYINCFYVHADFQRIGVGRNLMTCLFEKAQAWEIDRLYSDVSLTAYPFFADFGFMIVVRKTVKVRGVAMNNFRMEKTTT
ncbi:MAG TPA: GNAT family N-acetyltransferase [Rhodothermales bacterium]|nr:GNAT family N-acetyltransferase [Rhodothermales bacterium]